MQQAIYNNIDSTIRIQNTNPAANRGMNAPQAAGVLRWAARRWDLAGVLALMGSSAAYGVFTLAHLSL